MCTCPSAHVPPAHDTPSHVVPAAPAVQATLALLGLEHCRDTIVGDAMIR